MVDQQVYLIGNRTGRWCKIGVASDIPARMRCLSLPFQPCCLATLKVTSRAMARRVESHLHEHYAEKHLHQEWFKDISPRDFVRVGKELIRKFIEEENRIGEEEVKKLEAKRRMARFLSRKIIDPKEAASRDKLVLDALKTEGLDAARTLAEQL